MLTNNVLVEGSTVVVWDEKREQSIAAHREEDGSLLEVTSTAEQNRLIDSQIDKGSMRTKSIIWSRSRDTLYTWKLVKHTQQPHRFHQASEYPESRFQQSVVISFHMFRKINNSRKYTSKYCRRLRISLTSNSHQSLIHSSQQYSSTTLRTPCQQRRPSQQACSCSAPSSPTP
jgi:hypothetical protein